MDGGRQLGPEPPQQDVQGIRQDLKTTEKGTDGKRTIFVDTFCTYYVDDAWLGEDFPIVCTVVRVIET